MAPSFPFHRMYPKLFRPSLIPVSLSCDAIGVFLGGLYCVVLTISWTRMWKNHTVLYPRHSDCLPNYPRKDETSKFLHETVNTLTPKNNYSVSHPPTVCRGSSDKTNTHKGKTCFPSLAHGRSAEVRSYPAFR